MITTTKTGLARFIENCVAQGLTHVVCSPGSRNAPLIIALDNHPEIETTVVVDERSAAFFALGMAQQLNAPVGVVCTSGSAMLNYYPAVAEAYYQSVPLVVISADRPKEWVNHGDGQTIVQSGVYDNHIRAAVEIPEQIDEDQLDAFDAKIVQAFDAANREWKGPIHFNCPITEPMYDTVEVDAPKVPQKIERDPIGMTAEEQSELTKTWNASKKRLILCGQMEFNPSLVSLLADLCEDASVAVLVENTSNLVHPKFIHCIDRTLSGISDEELADFQPDILITLGGAVVSKRIKTFLRTSNIQSHWSVGAAFPEMDTYRKLTHQTNSTETAFLRSLLDIQTAAHPTNFGWKWKQLDFSIQEKVPVIMSGVAYSDLSVFEVVLDSIPDSAHLHMGNSSVVRYCQLFDPIKSIRYHSNRGTSGIDGSSSTAAGASVANQKDLHVLISGDLSFFYDSNAFWNNYLRENLKIIVINNGGGGIFKIINGPNSIPQLEQYFETSNKASVKGICEAYGLDYLKATTLVEVEEQMVKLLSPSESERPTLLEIFTENADNDSVLNAFFAQVKS